MKTRTIAAVLVLVTAVSSCSSSQDSKPKSLKDMGSVDQLLAPIALYPDQLIAQILMSAQDPPKVTDLDKWLKANTSLKGSQLQDAAVKAGFEPSLVALTLFPTVVARMADQISWTTLVGQAFASDKGSVFDAIQRLRRQATDVGTLKTTPQQAVSTKATSSGSNVIIIEPANPQIVYVPQYNPEVVYTQAPTPAAVPAAAPATTSNTTVVVVEEDDDTAEMVAAGMIGFATGIAIGATMSNPYYSGPYGWRGGGAYMYHEAWDDYYDHREDAREDWMDHREDIVEERGDLARDRQENVTDRRQNTQDQRTERQQNRTENRPEGSPQRATTQRAEGATAQRAEAAGAQRAEGAAQRPERTTAERPAAASSAAAPSQRTERQGSTEARGYGERTATTSSQTEQRRSSSDAFSGYQSGSSQRASSSRGQRSVSSSRGSSGASRSSRSRGGRL